MSSAAQTQRRVEVVGPGARRRQPRRGAGGRLLVLGGGAAAALVALRGLGGAFVGSPPATAARRFAGAGRSAALIRAAGMSDAMPVEVEDVEDYLTFEEKKDALKRCWAREYRSFFRPWEEEYYADGVSFRDPLLAVWGKTLYKMNMEFLNGQGMLGEAIIGDAYLDLHSIEDDPLDPYKLRTRWTAGFTVKALPWQPTAVFSGISEYVIDEDAKVLSQRDFWDTLNLADGGDYNPETIPGLQGFLDMTKQVLPPFLRGGDEPPASRFGDWLLLRKAADYRVYRSVRDNKVFAIGAPGSAAENSARSLAKALQNHGLAPGPALRARLGPGGELLLTDGSAGAAAAAAASASKETVLGVELLSPHPWENEVPHDIEV